MKWQAAWGWIAALTLALALGFALGHWSGARDALGDCPTEDSCLVDYHEGSWRVADTVEEKLEVHRDRLDQMLEDRGGRFGDD